METNRLRVIYIAGPYRSKTEYGVRTNIRNAEQHALFVWANGGVALCPQKNTAGFGGAIGNSEHIWLDGDLELIRRCDAVYIIPGWEESKGTKAEIDFAHNIGIPVLESRDDVLKFLGKYVDKTQFPEDFESHPERNDWP